MKRKKQTNWIIAEAMIQRGARPPIVTSTVDISRENVRSLWHDIHGTKPPQGLCPFNCLSKIQTHTAVMHANIFYLVYARRGQEVMRTADPEHIIAAYDSYFDTITRSDDKPALEFSTAWYIARDLRTLLLEVKYCRQCRLHYLYHPEVSVMQQCPYCRMVDIINKEKKHH